MKCRCGHGRDVHWPTQRNRQGYAKRAAFRRANPDTEYAKRLAAKNDHIKQPCHRLEGSTSETFPPCKCRDWRPEEVRA